MHIVLETNRLILRQFTLDDAPFFLRLANDPSWLQYIGDRKLYTLADAEQYLLNGSIKSYSENGFGFWIVLLKGTMEPIGVCGLARRPFLEDPDIGFAFLPEHTGLGYAYESAKATLKYALETLSQGKLCAICTPDNNRSIHLLEKLGFVFEKMIIPEDEEIMLFVSKP